MRLIKTSELRHKIDIQNNTPTTGDRGTNVDVWTDLYEDVPAKIKPLSGNELEIARQQVASATHEVTIRYKPNVNQEQRIQFGTRVFNVGHVENIDERNFWLILTCTEEK